MAKVELDPAFKNFRGSLGNFVYRKTSDGPIVAVRTRSTVLPSEGQLAVRRVFSDAAAYAKAMLADPVLGPRYRAAAIGRGLRPAAYIVTDFLTPPKVQAVDTAGYHGHVGEGIVVHATDFFEVAGVTVAIRNAADAVLEQGAAVLTESGWRYTATTAIAAGTHVTLQAIVTDRPGHTGEFFAPLVIG